jgi:hypothetical protein
MAGCLPDGWIPMIIPPAFKAGAKGIAERCGWIVKSRTVGRWNVSLKDDGSFPSDYHARKP